VPNRYDANGFNPPAVVALVSISIPGGSKIDNVRMLLDTGSDITVLPKTAVSSIGAIPVPNPDFTLTAYDGTQSAVACVRSVIRFSTLRAESDFAVIDGEIGIIGRDLLKFGRLELDGPGQSWTFETP
jgi:predicted aspartyl protease